MHVLKAVYFFIIFFSSVIIITFIFAHEPGLLLLTEVLEVGAVMRETPQHSSKEKKTTVKLVPP